MNFQPIPEEELSNSLKPGRCDFEVARAVDTVSKSGNEMVKLDLRVWDSEGKEGTVLDYLVSNVQWKILQFLKAVGKLELYEAGSFNPLSLVGLAGKAELAVQSDPSGKYGDRIRIKTYFKAESESGATSKPLSEDDIPF